MLKKTVVSFVMLAAGLGSALAANPIIYSQGSLVGGEWNASQNDTDFYGSFSTAYDDFTLNTTSLVTTVGWSGGFFNGPNPGNITAFNIGFYLDSGAAPGALVALFPQSITGNGNATGPNGDDSYNYAIDLNIPFVAQAGTKYWVSIQADLAYPPQWGWAEGTGGNGIGHQVFFGNPQAGIRDMAFSLSGLPVPEPATYLLFALGLAGLGAARARKAI
jgi:hypothetical protein